MCSESFKGKRMSYKKEETFIKKMKRSLLYRREVDRFMSQENSI